MIRVPAQVDRTFRLDAPARDAFALMHDVPRWGRLFPHVEAVEPMPEYGERVYRWRMEPLGPPGGRVRTVYACHYDFDEDALSLEWTPIAGVGNAAFSGGVTLADADRQTDGSLWLDAELDIPAPRFVARIVRATIGAEFGRMTDRFLARLADEVRGVTG